MSNWLLALLCWVMVLQSGLGWLNLRYTRRYAERLPAGLGSAIDLDTVRKMSAYGGARGLLALLREVWFRSLVIVAVSGGVLPLYDRWIGELASSFVLQGTLYVLIASWLVALLELPFDFYEQFSIEARHDFNRMSARLFWLDFVKGRLIVSLLLGLLCPALLSVVKWAGDAWWLLVWAVLLGFQVLVVLITPKFIEPLFVKMKPLESPELHGRIIALARSVGIRVKSVFEVDASRRSSHSNAYFTGVGPVKRVVLYDTLLARLDTDEIVAVLAHELGHWRHRHIVQRMAVSQLLTLGACYAAHHLVRWTQLPHLVHATTSSFFLRVTIVWLVGSIAGFGLEPIMNYWSRVHERQADAFAARHAAPRHLRSALIKLARDNLANLNVHPWYAAWHGSHPVLSARIARLSEGSSA